MRINQNISAMNTHSRLSAANNAKAGSLAKLSSGLRINKAGDDAAGLTISEKMRGQVGGLKQAVRNAQDGISLIQTAEGALSETHSILNRMRELTVQSNNGTNTSEDKGAIQAEIKQLNDEIGGISKRTEFNGQKLINGTLSTSVTQTTAATTALSKQGVANISSSGAKAGTYAITAGDAGAGTLKMTFAGKSQTISDAGGVQTLDFSELGIKIETNASYVADSLVGTDVVTAGTGAIKFQIGANANQELSLDLKDMGTTAAGLDLDKVDVNDPLKTFEDNLKAIDDAIIKVSAERSKLGAHQNRLDHTINNLTATAENLSEAESRIRDVDMAEEMMSFTKNNILSQAATSMLAQANQMPQSVLQLLQ